LSLEHHETLDIIQTQNKRDAGHHPNTNRRERDRKGEEEKRKGRLGGRGDEKGRGRESCAQPTSERGGDRDKVVSGFFNHNSKQRERAYGL
jgi:hypothetical protein